MVLREYRQTLIADEWIHHSRTPIPLAMKLSQIASYTRPLVRNAPRLWTVIDMAVILNPSHLYLHLDLSHQCLLDIVPGFSGDEEMFPALVPLMAHVHRWRCLRLVVNYISDLLPILTAFKKLYAPKLEELNFVSMESYAESDELSITGRFFRGGTPSLKILNITNIAWLPITDVTHDAWLPTTTRHLTHLKLHNMGFHAPLWGYMEFCQILSTMDNLVHLCMVGKILAMPTIVTHSNLTLPKLRSLKLWMEEDEDESEEHPDGWGNHYFAAILAMFNFYVRLKRLYFMSPPPTSLKHILQGMRSYTVHFAHVTELYWGIDFTNNADATTFMEAFPAVECLYLVDVTASVILDTLIKSPDLWRHLHTIDLASHDVPEARRLVESRINAGVPLQCLRMREPAPECYLEALEWLAGQLTVLWVPDDPRIYHTTE
ncbi:hypothetical protein FIBSPDRAFT_1036308 [Athelia psychrophila]|uniref:F-box domain-containing protein n=1 Tax=Athelia psychrophila TaxID=1759441 RepID=A0A166VYD1_9AGAM|nr:hypothetical protein FIBSPDRAFT_1036308 [Fibularhizoctonia sp. CBS 109695]